MYNPAMIFPTHHDDFTQRLQQLDLLLHKTGALWRPQPFKGDPAWVDESDLSEFLLVLSDQEVTAFGRDSRLLRERLSKAVPELAELERLIHLTEIEMVPGPPLSPHLQWEVPGRKWAQIEAFSRHVGSVHKPILEWCGGKGHLGRLLAVTSLQPVKTLEFNPALCSAGQGLAQRGRVDQTFQVIDVLGQVDEQHLIGRHAVALHACGELHRRLLRLAVEQRLEAFDIAPCCYHLGGAASRYLPFSDLVELQLSRDELRLAVTQTVTAKSREVVMRDREMAWKLGFNLLRQSMTGEGYQSIKPIDKQWLKQSFKAFCIALAAREGLDLVSAVDWESYESLGWQRYQRVMRFNLLRFAFARPLELWLVLDMAVWLQQQGYRVELKEFCTSDLTPRNLMLSARLEV